MQSVEGDQQKEGGRRRRQGWERDGGWRERGLRGAGSKRCAERARVPVPPAQADSPAAQCALIRVLGAAPVFSPAQALTLQVLVHQQVRVALPGQLGQFIQGVLVEQHQLLLGGLPEALDQLPGWGERVR